MFYNNINVVLSPRIWNLCRRKENFLDSVRGIGGVKYIGSSCMRLLFLFACEINYSNQINLAAADVSPILYIDPAIEHSETDIHSCTIFSPHN